MSKASIMARLTAMGVLVLGGAGGAMAASDLVPDAGNLATMGQVGIVNLGDQASEPSQLTLVCEKTSGAGSCAEHPAMAAYEDAAFPNAAVINVPALEPGESFVHDLAFWNVLTWQPGTYELTLMADAGDVIVEDDEANNLAVAEKQQQASVGVAPIPMGPGTLIIEPATGGGFPFKLQFTLGQ